MKNIKKLICIIIILSFIITMICGCDKDSDSQVIHIWHYYGTNEDLSSDIERYCKQNNISYQLHFYSQDELSFEDYYLKRNTSLAKNNTIVIGDINDMQNLDKNSHADYSNVEAYKNVADTCKNLPFISVGYNARISLINKKLLDYYNVEYSQDIILQDDLSDIVFELINNGAVFNAKNLSAIYINSLLEKYNIGLTYNSTAQDIDDVYEENLKSAVEDIINKNFKYNMEAYDCLNYIDLQDIVDEKTNMKLAVGFEMGDDNFYTKFGFNGTNSFVESLKDTIVYFEPFGISYGIYIGKSVTNESVYDLANFMMSRKMISNYTTLKNNKYGNMEYLSASSDEELSKYYHENEQELIRINEVLNKNIFNGNISSEVAKIIESKSFNLSGSVMLYLVSAIEANSEKNMSSEEYIKETFEDFISRLKIRF